MKYIILLLILSSIAFSKRNPENNNPVNPIAKKEAFSILTNKCNVCHKVQNPNKVFTYDNMNKFSSKINRQVFVWKRMPKGNEIKLSTQEKQTLKNWINSVK